MYLHERRNSMAAIQKWGNSLAVRIPSKLANQLRVTAGTQVEISTKNGSILVTPRRRKQYSLREMLRKIKPENVHELIEFGPDVGREVVD
jgi:antitoxin MazE